MRYFISILLCLCAFHTNAQRQLSVRTDEFVEMMEIIARYAGNTVFTDTLAPRYQQDCDTYFKDHIDHPAIVWMRDQLPHYCIGYDAVPWMGAHLKWTDEGFTTIPNCNKAYKRWSKEAVDEFLPLITNFYLKTNFNRFYNEHHPMYKRATDAFSTNIGNHINLDWFDKFFQVNEQVDFGVIIGMNNGAGSFGIERQIPGKRREKISVMLYAEREDGTPLYTPDDEEDKILVHEFCHSYIHPDSKYKKAAKILLAQHKKKLDSMGYGHWENVVEETLVRASVIRYMIDHQYSEDAIRKEIDSQHKYYGFTWLPTDINWYKGDILNQFNELAVD